MIVVDITRPGVEEYKVYGVVPWNTYGANDDELFNVFDIEWLPRARLGRIAAVSRNVND
jgi:hypothetical protein